MTVKLNLSCESLNFYWMVEGFKEFTSDEPFKVCWEDINYDLFKDGVKVREGSTTLETKGFWHFEVDRLKGDFGEKMELKFPGYVKEQLEAVICDGLTYEGLIASDNYHYQFCYDDPTNPEKYEISDMIGLPYDEFGMAPCYISTMIPEMWLSKEIVEKYMKLYINKFFRLNVDEIEWVDGKDYEYLKKEYDEEIARIKEWGECAKNGEKMTVKILPQPLRMFVDPELVDKWVARGLKVAEQLEDSEEFLLEFEDGHTEISGATPEIREMDNEEEQARET